jgi:hypothetical protein
MLRGYCQVRSGDKGDTSDLTVFAPNQAFYQALLEQLTAAQVTRFFKGLVRGRVKIYPLPKVLGIHLVMSRALGGGASASLRSDQLGKSMASAILRFQVEIPAEVLKRTTYLKPPQPEYFMKTAKG